MLSLRSSAIALVTSAVIVGVLVGMTTADFTAASQDPPTGQALPVDQQSAGQRNKPLAPPIIAPAPNPVEPPVAAAAPNPVQPPVIAAAPNPVEPPAPARRYVPIYREPVVQPVAHRQTVVPPQPIPPVPQPDPEPPAKDRPDSPPASSALPERHSKSRTMNTEPCACDGKMRHVQTHWDPPQG